MLNEQAVRLVVDDFLSIYAKTCGSGPTAQGLKDNIWKVFDGVKSKLPGLGWLELLKLLPTIVAALQELGPEIEKIVAIITRLLESFRPVNPGPVVNPL